MKYFSFYFITFRVFRAFEINILQNGNVYITRTLLFVKTLTKHCLATVAYKQGNSRYSAFFEAKFTAEIERIKKLVEINFHRELFYSLQEGSGNGELQEFHKLSTLIKRAGVKSMETAIQFIVKVRNSLKPFDVASPPHKLSTAWTMQIYLLSSPKPKIQN